MSKLPGFNPRPEHRISDLKNVTESVTSSNKATFVHVKGCEDVVLDINGKIGKMVVEQCVGMKIHFSDNIVGGMLDLIKCRDVAVECRGAALVPIIQIDDSTHVNITLEKTHQLECIIFIRSNDIKLSVYNQEGNQENGVPGKEFQVASASDALEDEQKAGHWNSGVECDFITENFSRTNGKDSSGLPLWPAKVGQTGVNCLK